MTIDGQVDDMRIEVWERSEPTLYFLVRNRLGQRATLTGFSAEMFIKDNAGTTDGSPIAGSMVSGGSFGEVAVQLGSAHTITPSMKRYKFDIIDTMNKRKTVGAGPFRICDL